MNKEQKREPLRLARVNKILDSRDGSQRIVGVTYQNVRRNKDGQWIGIATKVERCVKDVICVDEALNDATLHPIMETSHDTNIDTDIGSNKDPMTEVDTDIEPTVNTELEPTVELEATTEKPTHDRNTAKVTTENTTNHTVDTDKSENTTPESEVSEHTNTNTNNAGTTDETESQKSLRRSKRILNRPNPIIPAEDIGENDDQKDIDYVY